MKIRTEKSGIINRKIKGYRIDTTVAEATAFVIGAAICAGYTVVGFGKGAVRGAKYTFNKIKEVKSAGNDCTK